MSGVAKFSLDQQMRFLFAYLGVNEARLLQAAKLPRNLFNKKNIAVSADEYFRLLEVLTTLGTTGTPLALRMLDIPIFSMMSPPIMAALCAPNFQVCVERLQQYKPLIGPLRLILSKTKDTFSVEIAALDDEFALHKELIATELVFFVSLIRHATGETISPISVEANATLTHPGYDSFFRCAPRYSNANRLTFQLSDAMTTFKLRNDAAWDFFEPEIRKRLDELEKDDSFAAAVRAALMELLPLGDVSINKVAEKLFVSNRTLQRKLQGESTSFQAQLNHSRELLARHYLKNSAMSVTEIAFLIGYQEASSFTRAFTAWTGSPPENFRSKELAKT